MTREEQERDYQIHRAAIDSADYELKHLSNLAFTVNAKADYDNGFTRGFKEGAKWADEHPKSPWISVTERLPEEDSNCIVTNNISGGTSIAYYLRDAEVWLDAYSGDEIHGITHWFYKPKFEET